eukprot:6372666-Alexandrium_andersonii.AAC.1
MHGRRLQLPRLAAGQPGPEATLSLRRVYSPRLRAVTPGRPPTLCETRGRGPRGARVGAIPSTATAASRNTVSTSAC